MASDQQRRTEILREGLGDLDELAAISRRPGDIDTPSVSHPSVAEALKAASPAAIGVSGTTLIKPPVLGCLGVPMINIHAGWTPHYRGSHGAYWAVVARDWEHCGVTVHLVDAGVDTGGILCRVLIKPDERDSVYSLAAKQTVAGLSAMARCLDLAQRGQFPPSIRAETKGKVFYTPTLTSYGRLRQNIRNSGR
jgi:methionyl-tRNA formyltransferase